ncbi:MAG: RNA polymerase sigma24 factor [Gemmatales bacterium]|nr:MAG: RNA polymerase sigma24 factor [Gemmatales bacterium]
MNITAAESEDTLVEQAKKGNRAAFEELVRRISRLIFARLYLETGDVHRAEDLLQETLLSAFRALPKLADASRFRPWLLAIAQNVAADAARFESRKKRDSSRLSSAEELGRIPSKEPPPQQELEQQELRAKVLAVLRGLPDEYRLPLTLRYISGADYDTICEQLRLSNGSLRGLLHRGMNRLRTELERLNVFSAAD